MIIPSITRRAFCLGAISGSALLAMPGLRLPRAAAGDHVKTTLTADQALDRLKQGNADYVANKPRSATAEHDRRAQLARSQAPFAAVLSCSDSRVPPELLFNAHLGDIFVVRNAGHTVDTAVLGSLEYATMVLGAPLIVVLGHERCGAVDAALSVVQKDASFSGNIDQMIDAIIPAALLASKDKLQGDELLDAAVRENVKRTVNRLRRHEPTLGEAQAAGHLKVVGARYDLDSGEVAFLA